MYDEFYGFRERPFSLLPDPEFLYLGKMHGAALAMLEYGIVDQAGFTVVTGEIGCGKTTLVRHLLNTVDSQARIGLVTNTHESLGDLVQWLLMAFDIETPSSAPVDQYRQLVDFLIATYAENRRSVIIVDEAQNLSVSMLEQLRMISNINVEKHQVVQLVLVGQPQLLDKLRRPELAQFAQRVAVDYFIEPLDEEEVGRYIRHRLKVAGAKPGLIRRKAYPLIYMASGGVPRLINLICDRALVYGYAARRRTIDAGVIREVVGDKLRRRGLFRLEGRKEDPEHDGDLLPQVLGTRTR